ncbi:hypothetical protein BC827DRAFT_1271479 [Russula dissimulans]|nr:hypothetical protein BC827DRAFT_1271479 [Russula dissimulans]
MPHCLSATVSLQVARRVDRSTPHDGSQPSRPQIISVHMLDDDSLLNVFRLYRPALLDKEEVSAYRMLQGGQWVRERWWYKLTRVCQRWRSLILGSTRHLDLSLVCSYGTPVAEMLAHSPSLPLTIDHLDDDHVITPGDGEGIMAALRRRDRVRRIRLVMPALDLQKFIKDMDEEFSMLEHLFISPSTNKDTRLVLPHTFRAPSLRHLVLFNFAFPTRPQSPTTQTGFVAPTHEPTPPYVDFNPDDFLEQLSLMPQLETLWIHIDSSVPNHEVEGRAFHAPIMTPITLPNLRWFGFGGISAYLEALLPRITAPLLEKLDIMYFNLFRFSVPHLVQFMNTAENLRLNSADLLLHEKAVILSVKPHAAANAPALYLSIACRHVDSQVAFTAQVFKFLSPVLSGVMELSLYSWEHSLSSMLPNINLVLAHPSYWRDVLRPFSNVKSLSVHSSLAREISRSFPVDDGESHMELLPELNELRCYGRGDAGDAFTAFINARENAGHPITLVRQ